jgi:uncharacterized Zn-finger protein
MSFKRSIAGPWIYRIVLVLIIAFSATIMYLVDRIDKIIHVQLYGFGLQFSTEWAEPYWLLMWIIYGSLAVMIILSAIILVASFIKPQPKFPTYTPKQEPTQVKVQPIIQAPKETQPQPKPTIENQPPPLQTRTEPPQQTKPKPKTVNKIKTAATSTIGCPSCRKTFTQPLVMLDFEGGKSKLVNVCPYCNQVLGDNEEKID